MVSPGFKTTCSLFGTTTLFTRASPALLDNTN